MRDSLRKRAFAVLAPALFAVAFTSAPSAGMKTEREPETVAERFDKETRLLADGNLHFAMELYRHMRAEGGDFVVSPLSISSVFAMAYAGARGETAGQMEEVLRWPMAGPSLHGAFHRLNRSLAAHGQRDCGLKEPRFLLHSANSLWVEQSVSLERNFIETMTRSYGSGVRKVDFRGRPEACRREINRWARLSTEGKIDGLLSPGMVTASARLVLANAAYMNAPWEEGFDPKKTRNRPFQPLHGETVSTPFMHGTGSYGYAEGDNYQAVELVYAGRKLSAVMIMAKQKGFAALEDGLTASRVKRIVHELTETTLRLRIPKFGCETGNMDLKRRLCDMGMPMAFSPLQADFTGIDPTGDLFISHAVHTAMVRVDEQGTEAAAASATIGGFIAPPGSSPKPVVFDRPFVFFIRDIPTQSMVFMGRIVENAGSIAAPAGS